MNKLTKKIFAVFTIIASVSFMTSCNKTTENPSSTLPPANGNVDIKFLNFPGAGDVSTSAMPGAFLSVAVQVQKTSGGNKPQYLRVYEADSINTRGKMIGSKISLRNTSDAQIKNVNYTFPATASQSKYIYFEVDESNSAFSRKLLIINPTSNATLNSYTSITLGAQGNAAPSRISSATGQLYSACNASSNISDIDITYGSTGSPTPMPTFVSNPFRIDDSIGLKDVNATGCEDDGTAHNTSGGPVTYFALATAADFTNATNATLNAFTVSGTNQSIKVNAGDVIAFKRADGKKGFIKVNSIPDTGVNGTINFDLKVQR